MAPVEKPVAEVARLFQRRLEDGELLLHLLRREEIAGDELSELLNRLVPAPAAG